MDARPEHPVPSRERMAATAMTQRTSMAQCIGLEGASSRERRRSFSIEFTLSEKAHADISAVIVGGLHEIGRERKGCPRGAVYLPVQPERRLHEDLISPNADIHGIGRQGRWLAMARWIAASAQKSRRVGGGDDAESICDGIDERVVDACSVLA